MLGALWLLLEKKGRNPEEYISRQHYHPDHSAKEVHRLNFDEFIKLHLRVANEFQDPTLGLQVGACVHPSHLGALGYAFLASSSLRTAYYRAQRFIRMVHTHIVANIDEAPGYMRMSWNLTVPIPFAHQFAESRLAAALILGRMSFGNELKPVAVSLSRDYPEDATPWENFFDCPIRFKRQNNTVTFAENDMRRVLTASNRELVALHEDALHRQSRSMDRSGIINRARSLLIDELPTGRVTEALLAERLNMGQRTLQRRLREQDETFRGLLTKVRKDMATRYVRDPEYRMTEIAFLLGFSDSSAFSRAFRSWFGESPTSARNAIED